MSDFQIQDLGDGNGLDVLDENHDMVLSGRTEIEVAEWAEELEPTDDVTILAGALGREADEQVTPADLANELA